MRYLLFAMAFVHSAAHATGLPPWEEVQVVDADCEALEGPSRKFFITFDRFTGNCAPPGPDGDSCSTHLQASLNARRLRLWRQDCAEPLPGRFVRAGRCGERPRWRWQGRLDAGHTLGIGRGFAGDLAAVQVDGSMSTAECPRESPRTHPVRTEVEVRAPSPPRWIAFPADGYAVVVEGDEARLQFTPGPALEHWFLQNDDVVFESDRLDAAQARSILAGALKEPTGLAVKYQIMAHREWFEGWRQRGLARCERILQMDLEQRIRPTDPDSPLGPPMRTTVQLREWATAVRCFPEDTD